MAKHVGLLIVHGIGEQKRFETARQLARSIMAGLQARGDGAHYSLIDRASASDDQPIDCPRIDPASSPFMIAWRAKGSSDPVYLHLHEVWWADLGAPATLGEQIRFWLWGLGQWSARVVWRTHFKDKPSNTDLLMEPPTKFKDVDTDDHRAFPRPFARTMLFLSAFLALLTLFSWEAVKRAFSWLSSAAGSPSILTSYIGDVRIYTQAPGKGGGNLTDVGQPWRATVRRRMVTQLVAMAERDYERWYLLGHSLGSIVAFNGVQETEWNLPNYLDPAQVARIKEGPLKDSLWLSDPPLSDDPKPDLTRMMPRRPVWLGDHDRLSREALFKTFRGLVTYGSPLDKFAALWPRIVPINTRRDVLPAEADWINLSDATDPVGAQIGAFENGWRTGTQSAESPMNIRVRASPFFLLAHIKYFGPPTPGRQDRPETRALTNLLFPQDGQVQPLRHAFADVGRHYGSRVGRVALAIASVAVLAVALVAATSWLALILRQLGDKLASTVTKGLSARWPDWEWPGAVGITPRLPEQLWRILTDLLGSVPISGFTGTMVTTIIVAVLVVFMAGVWRRARET